MSKKRGKIIPGVVVAVIGLSVGGWVWFQRAEGPVDVQTDKATRRDLTEIVVANGRIQPVTQVKISPEVSGEIIDLPVKEGQSVKKGDLLVRIKPDYYEADRNSAKASHRGALAGLATAQANFNRAEAELKRNRELFEKKLISESAFMDVQTSFEVAQAQLVQAGHQIEMTKAALDKAEEDLRKTTIYSPLDGTVTKMISQVGERVVGTAMMAGTDIMVVSDLSEMEARVDISEIDVVLIKPGQTARLEADAFKDRKFKGVVTEIANSAKGSQIGGSATSSGSGSSTGEATKFEVRIRLKELEDFRPGMSVTAEIETRYRTNVVAVPIGAVTARAAKPAATKLAGAANPGSSTTTNAAAAKPDRKITKPREIVFVLEGDKVREAPVRIGISDDSHWEILEGLTEGQEIVTGGFKAVTRDLEDGKRVRRGFATTVESDAYKKD
jgi:HlyD family secretion protein